MCTYRCEISAAIKPLTVKLTMYITKLCWLVKFVHIISKQMVSMNNNYNIFYDLTPNSLFETEALVMFYEVYTTICEPAVPK